jgi:threonine/homoserine/homoserine lactone efflux protein
MAPAFLLKGLVMGFCIAAPVGPIGVLCIRRSLAYGQLHGFVTGMGAATADALYGCVAAFGLTVISDFLVGQRFWLSLVGGVFLCYLGARTFLSRPAEQAASARADGLLSAYVSTLALTLTNPITILSFVAAFAGFGLGTSPDYASAAAMVLGVFLGSATWWLILSGGVGSLRSRIRPAWLQAVNRLSGAVIFGFGAYALASLFRS